MTATGSWIRLAIVTWIQILRPIRFICRRPQRSDREPRVLIESGKKGWELIEKIELHASAVEYLGTPHVVKLIIDSQASYITQVGCSLRTQNPTHYVCDIRSLWKDNSKYMGFRAITQYICLVSLLFWYNVVPISLLGNPEVRVWRRCSIIVTALSGVIICPYSMASVRGLFPHPRCCFLPTYYPSLDSARTLVGLVNKIPEADRVDVAFSGSIYKPRSETLEAIAEGLEAHGINVCFSTHSLGRARVSNDDYWRNLARARIVINTVHQISNSGTDRPWLSAFNGRCFEAMLVGALLVTPHIDGFQRFFSAGQDYVVYTTPEDAVNKITHYLKNDVQQRSIAANGQRKLLSQMESKLWWSIVDNSLGEDGLL